MEDLPLVEKIQILMSMVKEFGYANVNYKITDDKNSLEVKGKLSDNDKEEIKKICGDLGLKTNIREIILTENRIQTIISFENIINAQKFKDVYRKMKVEQIKQEQIKSGTLGSGMGGGLDMGGGFGGGDIGMGGEETVPEPAPAPEVPAEIPTESPE
jgi:hypothetical protein